MRPPLISFVRRHAQAKCTEAALHSWQQTADEQEMELAALRGALDQAQKVVDSFARKPPDVIGLAESLRRYREMRDGCAPKSSGPPSQAARAIRG